MTNIDPAIRDGLAELSLLYGAFMVGRWVEVMTSDDDPAEDWEEVAAYEAVDLFAPGAERFLSAAEQKGYEQGKAATRKTVEEVADALARIYGTSGWPVDLLRAALDGTP